MKEWLWLKMDGQLGFRLKKSDGVGVTIRLLDNALTTFP
jgi:hypothetical protein